MSMKAFTREYSYLGHSQYHAKIYHDPCQKANSYSARMHSLDPVDIRGQPSGCLELVTAAICEHKQPLPSSLATPLQLCVKSEKLSCKKVNMPCGSDCLSLLLIFLASLPVFFQHKQHLLLKLVGWYCSLGTRSSYVPWYMVAYTYINIIMLKMNFLCSIQYAARLVMIQDGGPTIAVMTCVTCVLQNV